jgi:hypothetical protein
MEPWGGRRQDLPPTPRRPPLGGVAGLLEVRTLPHDLEIVGRGRGGCRLAFGSRGRRRGSLVLAATTLAPATTPRGSTATAIVRRTILIPRDISHAGRSCRLDIAHALGFTPARRFAHPLGFTHPLGFAHPLRFTHPLRFASPSAVTLPFGAFPLSATTPRTPVAIRTPSPVPSAPAIASAVTPWRQVLLVVVGRDLGHPGQGRSGDLPPLLVLVLVGGCGDGSDDPDHRSVDGKILRDVEASAQGSDGHDDQLSDLGVDGIHGHHGAFKIHLVLGFDEEEAEPFERRVAAREFDLAMYGAYEHVSVSWFRESCLDQRWLPGSS